MHKERKLEYTRILKLNTKLLIQKKKGSKKAPLLEYLDQEQYPLLQWDNMLTLFSDSQSATKALRSYEFSSNLSSTKLTPYWVPGQMQSQERKQPPPLS